VERPAASASAAATMASSSITVGGSGNHFCTKKYIQHRQCSN
jgi:hypothetical protein